MKPGKKRIKKKLVNYWVDLVILVLFTALAASGIVLLAVYHIGDHRPAFLVMGLDQDGWLAIHKMMSIPSGLGIGLHLQLHFKRFRAELGKGFLVKRSLYRQSSYYLFHAYGISGILGLVSWALNNSTMGSHPHLQHILVEIHDKISFVLIFLFVLHLKNGMGWLLNRTKDVLTVAFARQ